jgi:DNA ligase-1
VYLIDLAQTLEKLESAGGRLAAVAQLAGVFSRAAHSEIGPIVYMLQGGLRPPFEGIELGIGERLLIRILATCYATTAADVTRRLGRAGDLGSVAATLAPRSRTALRITIKEAYAVLARVARTRGTGSVERKATLVIALLRRATSLEARYLVRIVLGRLRLGIGDATIIEAAAAGALGDPRQRGLIEHAYNVRSDLGAIVRLAFERGERGLAHIGPRVGIPVRPALAQRLPSALGIARRLKAMHVEPKYDGFRLQLHRDGNRVWAFSRRLEDVTPMFPELTAAMVRQLRARRAIIEGEAVAYDPRTGRFLSFQTTMTRKRKHGIVELARRSPLRLFAFDLLYADGRNYLDRPQHERYRRLRRLLRSGRRGAVAVTESLRTDRAPELQAYFEKMIGRGLEGIVAKRPDAPYHAGARGFDWIKLKRAYQSRLRDTVDLVIVGYFAGRGKRARLGVGSLLGAVYDPAGDRFRTVARIGSGLSERGWEALRAELDRHRAANRPFRVDSRIAPTVWIEPHVVVEVLADEITRSPLHCCGRVDGRPGYALRFPRLLGGTRTDKGPEDATTEREILDMYRQQRLPPVKEPP